MLCTRQLVFVWGKDQSLNFPTMFAIQCDPLESRSSVEGAEHFPFAAFSTCGETYHISQPPGRAWWWNRIRLKIEQRNWSPYYCFRSVVLQRNSVENVECRCDPRHHREPRCVAPGDLHLHRRSDVRWSTDWLLVEKDRPCICLSMCTPTNQGF